MTASVGIVVIVTLVVALFTAPTPGVLAYHGSDRHFTNVKLPVNWERHVASKSAPASLADRVLPHSIAAKTGLKISTRAENLNATETRVSPEVLLDHNVETIQRNRTSIITFEPTVICKLYATFDTTTCPGPDKLDAQLNMLNSVYNKYAFEFRLGEVRYVYDDKIALEPVMRNSFELTDIAVQWISEFHRGDTLSLNVYIREEGLMGRFDPTLGTALQSGALIESWPVWADGIVLRAGTLPGMTTFPGTYDQGGVLVHEVGHWLGLQHVFTTYCDESDIAFGIADDTPATTLVQYTCDAVARATVYCASTREANQESPVTNFMSYASDSCRSEFSPGQVKMMHFVYQNMRLPLSERNHTVNAR